MGSGESSQCGPQLPGSGPVGPLLQPPSPTPHDGGGGGSGQPPPARSKHSPFLSTSTLGSRCKANGHPLGPHFHGQPLPRGLCISLPRFSIAITSAHTGVSMGNSGPALAHESRLGHRAASMLGGVCSPEGEPQPWGSRGICPRTASAQTSPACPLR